MDVRDLNILDWLLWDNVPCQVTAIGCDYIETTKCGITLAESHLLQGVPLTPEILEKNGFWYQDNVGYVMEEYEYEIIYDLWDHKLRILKNREQILNLEYFNQMCFHELQHALKLCGIYKEITI